GACTPPGMVSSLMGVPSGMTLPSSVCTTTWGCCRSWRSNAASSACCCCGSSFDHARLPLHLGNAEQPSHGPRLPRRRLSGEPHFSHCRSVVKAGGVGYLMRPCLSRFTTHLTWG